MPNPSPSALRTDILARQDLAGHVASGSDASIATWYADSDESGPRKGSFLTELGIYDVLGPEAGETLLATLEAVAAANQQTSPVIKRILGIIKNGSGTGNESAGLDFGSPMVQTFLAALAAASVISGESKDALVAYGSRPWSRAEKLWGEGVVVTSDDVATALRG